LSHEKSATENFYTATELFANQEDFQSAIRIYEKILALNPDEVKASKRLDDLKSGIYLKKRRRRRRIMVIAQTGILMFSINHFLCMRRVSTVDFLNIVIEIFSNW
jgi:tetratricopeptide (TPR) repeat protein